MDPVRRAGRVIGVLIAVQLVGGFLVNFVLEKPIFGAPGFLANAAPHEQQLAVGALLAMVLEALWLAIAVTAFPLFFERVQPLALWFLALAAALLALAVVEKAAVMSMVTVGQKRYVNASPSERAQLETVRIVVASARNWSHFLAQIAIGCDLRLLRRDAATQNDPPLAERVWPDRHGAADHCRRHAPLSAAR